MAIEQPHMGRFPAQQVVSIPILTAHDEMGQAIHSALEEISRALAAENVIPTGPWFAHHHRRPTDTFDFDVCFPVKHPVTLSGRLQAIEFPETTVVRTAYHGSYDGLPEAWREFIAWVDDAGYALRGDFFEKYSVGPREVKDPEAWQTDLMMALAEGEMGKEQGA